MIRLLLLPIVSLLLVGLALCGCANTTTDQTAFGYIVNGFAQAAQVLFDGPPAPAASPTTAPAVTTH